MKKSKITYDIVCVDDLKIYRVFENIEEQLYYKCIFSSQSRKECVEYIKNKNKKKRKKVANENN